MTATIIMMHRYMLRVKFYRIKTHGKILHGEHYCIILLVCA